MSKKDKKQIKKEAKTEAKAKPYVRYTTISNSVGQISNPGESKILKVGKHRVLLTRGDKLDKYGNPVHTATLIDEKGRLQKSYRGNGAATTVVSVALKQNGIEVKYPKRVGKRKNGNVKTK